MLTQLPTPIPLTTPKGKAWAVAIIDYGPQWDLLWVTFVHDSAECWTFHNRDIRQERNDTFGLNHQSPLHPFPAAYEAPLHDQMPLNGANGLHKTPQ